jgi:hypothetical protein
MERGTSLRDQEFSITGTIMSNHPSVSSSKNLNNKNLKTPM